MEDSIGAYILYLLEMRPIVLSPVALSPGTGLGGFLIERCWLKAQMPVSRTLLSPPQVNVCIRCGQRLKRQSPTVSPCLQNRLCSWFANKCLSNKYLSGWNEAWLASIITWKWGCSWGEKLSLRTSPGVHYYLTKKTTILLILASISKKNAMKWLIW